MSAQDNSIINGIHSSKRAGDTCAMNDRKKGQIKP